MGEDMVATELVLPANHVLSRLTWARWPVAGMPRVNVRRKPRVAIIPTGTELVTVEQVSGGMDAGRETLSNTTRSCWLRRCAQWGGEPTRYPIVPDDYERIKAAVLEAAATHDLVLVNAGSSAGSEDFTARVVEELGKLLVHGVAVRPGHPVILGMHRA